MNVYVAEVAKQLAARGVEVDIFTRATTGAVPPIAELVPGVSVRHVTAGPYEGLSKADLPGQLCAFTAGVMRAAAARPEGWYDLRPLALLAVRPGRLAGRRPLGGRRSCTPCTRWPGSRTCTSPTGDSPEPPGREIGEAQVVEAADRLVANTDGGGRASSSSCTTPIPARSASSPPGVDLDDLHARRPAAARSRARPARLTRGCCSSSAASSRSRRPDVLLRVGAELLRRRPRLARDDGLIVAVVGGPERHRPGPPRAPRGARRRARASATSCGSCPPVARPVLRSGTAPPTSSSCPSHSESFGLVAWRPQACGTPVVAADVGGLPTAVGDARAARRRATTSGDVDATPSTSLLVDRRAARDARRRAVAHAQQFGWAATTDRLLEVYRRGAPRSETRPPRSRAACRRRGPRAAARPADRP